MAMMAQCPICDEFVEEEDLQQHVNSHFDDADHHPQQECDVCGASLPASEAASHRLAHELEQAEGRGSAPGEISAAAKAAAEELDAQAAVALAAAEWGDDDGGFEDTHGGDGGGGDSDSQHHEQQLEALYFEQLQSRYGFAPLQRPGCCRLCGGEGHWVRDCPRNPDRQEAQQERTATAKEICHAGYSSGARGCRAGCYNQRPSVALAT